MAALNIGIIGCGHMAEKMVNTIRQTRGFRAYAVASRSPEKASDFAKAHHVKKAYGSYEELARDKHVDLVYIATPHSEHYANAKMCIEYGRPCLVEKAFTVTKAQAQELFDLADEKKVFITEAIWTRYMPFLQTIREVLASGVIGDPVMLSANLNYPVKVKPRLTDPELAGGTLLDIGVYPINIASMLFGDDLLRVEISGTYTARGLDEQENITFIYRDGRIAVLSASMLGVSDRKAVISGTRGYVIIDNVNNFEGMTVYDSDHRKIVSYRRPRQKTGYEYELKACRSALRSGRTECPEMPHSETILMMQIMDDLRAQMGIVYPVERGEVTDRTHPTVQDGKPGPEAGTPVCSAAMEETGEKTAQEIRESAEPAKAGPAEEAGSAGCDDAAERTLTEAEPQESIAEAAEDGNLPSVSEAMPIMSAAPEGMQA